MNTFRPSYFTVLVVGIIAISCNSANSVKQTPDLKSSGSALVIDADKKWIGEWNRSQRNDGAGLSITAIEKDSIVFSMNAQSGGNTGEIEGKAKTIGVNAIYMNVDDRDTCIIEFTLRGDSLIEVNQEKGDCGAAMGVYYSGNYYNEKYRLKPKDEGDAETLYAIGILDTATDLKFKQLVKDKYQTFISSTQLTSDDSDLDQLRTHVQSSGVRGLYTILENIIMVDSAHNIWAAVVSDDKVYYFTTRKDYEKKMPKTIENWMERFSDDTVIYCSAK